MASSSWAPQADWKTPMKKKLMTTKAGMTLSEYFATPETKTPQELIYGVLRAADAPFTSHQSAVGDFHLALAPHVRERGLGEVWLSPIDVILDADRQRPLVVQPDLLFVSNERQHIVAERIWGAPDMVLEVLSPHPRIGRLEERIEWFARYGVRECWLHQQAERQVVILCFVNGRVAQRRVFDFQTAIRSDVFPAFAWALNRILAYRY